MKVAIDIFKGIQDTDAKYLAEKLEFKGPLLDEVNSLLSAAINIKERIRQVLISFYRLLNKSNCFINFSSKLMPPKLKLIPLEKPWMEKVGCFRKTKSKWLLPLKFLGNKS